MLAGNVAITATDRCNNVAVKVPITIPCVPAKVSRNHRPASETPLKRRFTSGPMAARYDELEGRTN